MLSNDKQMYQPAMKSIKQRCKQIRYQEIYYQEILNTSSKSIKHVVKNYSVCYQETPSVLTRNINVLTRNFKYTVKKYQVC